MHLDRYEILSLLGEGGMGEVYRARDSRLGREVAIKVLPAAFSQDADRLRRFEQEARAAGMLNHTNILTVYDIGTYDGSPYIVSELLEGEELRAQLRRGALPVQRAVDYAKQIACALSTAHEKGIMKIGRRSHPMEGGWPTSRMNRAALRSTCRASLGEAANDRSQPAVATTRAGGGTGRSCSTTRRAGS